MKKYKFLIKKTKEMEIELCAENHSEAMFELLQKAVKGDKNFFTENTKDKKDLFINIEEIIDENGKENLKDYEDFIKENKFFISNVDENIVEENDEEIEDDLPREYAEIVCENCGHCILMDEIIHQLES